MVRSSPSKSKNKAKPLPKLHKGKLPRGYKKCGKCQKLLNIHTYLCTYCGFRHEMKKKKFDMLKDLKKPTLKLVKALIEIDKFNDILKLDHHPMPVFENCVMPLSMSYFVRSQSTRSSKPQKSLYYMHTNHDTLHYLKLPNPLLGLSLFLDGVIFIYSIYKHSSPSYSQMLTLRAYSLHNLHRVGETYHGNVWLNYLVDHKVQVRIACNYHVFSVKTISNRLAMLTGRHSVVVFAVDPNIAKGKSRYYYIKSNIEVSLNQDQVTIFYWIKTGCMIERTFLLIGTLLGHLYVYKLCQKTATVYRFINKAHNEWITAISYCPLSSSEYILFVSGSYDGSISIWSLRERTHLYRFECSNKKISNLQWDSGAKFLLIISDYQQDSCVYACFFSIIKHEETILANQAEYRVLRGTGNSIIGSHDDNSSWMVFIDAHTTIIRVISLELLRKNSVRRKTNKKEEEFEKGSKLEFTYEEVTVRSYSIKYKSSLMCREQLPLPMISDVCHQSVGSRQIVYGTTFSGFMFTLYVLV